MFSNKCINALFIIYLLLISPSFSSQLLSHKATYILNVENIKNSFLEGGQGQTFFEIQEVCDGWNVREDYVLIYELPNKKSAKSFSSFTTFENKISTKHSFQLTEKSDLNGKNDYQGFVEKNKKNISGSMINRNIKKLTFNKNTLFLSGKILLSEGEKYSCLEAKKQKNHLNFANRYRSALGKCHDTKHSLKTEADAMLISHLINILPMGS